VPEVSRVNSSVMTKLRNSSGVEEAGAEPTEKEHKINKTDLAQQSYRMLSIKNHD